MQGCTCAIQRQLGRTGEVGLHSASAMLTVVAQVPVLEVVAEEGFQQQSAVCWICGVGDHGWHEGVLRWSVQYASEMATYHRRYGPVGMVSLDACIK